MAEILELIVPGLLGPLPPSSAPPLRTPALDLLLARAAREPTEHADLSTALLACFGADADAPYALAADAPDWDRSGWWLHADPVHLRPDRDLLRLFDARHLGISGAEADALVAELNGTFGADGLEFCAPVAQRWYLRCERPPMLATTSVGQVVGQHVDGHLPTGDDARRWAALMTEAQMLLFQSDVNRRREAEGRPAVNALWCWGGGDWQAPMRPPALAVGSSPLLQGLATAAGIALQADPGGDASALVSGPAQRIVAVWGGFDDALLERDVDAWAGAAAALDRWAAPLPAALRSGALAELRIDPCNGSRLVLRRGTMRWYRSAFWRRSTTLAARAMLPPR